MRNKSKPIFLLLLTIYCLLPAVLYGAQEMLKTQKVKIGEKAPLTEMLKKANEEKKTIVLVILPNPMQCNRCDSFLSLLEKEAEKYKDNSSFIMAGGQDIIGAASEETIALKRLYGFVTVGEAWTFIIDRDGVLRKIFIGTLSQQELEGTLNEIAGRKEEVKTREFTLTVTDGEIELNGSKFMVWKYNDTFPGPEIRVKEGDVVRVKLLNKSSAKHGLFFHGLHVNPRVSLQEQEIVVDPGYEYTYGEFVAGPPGTHLYHCSYNMAEHLSRGLYGAFIVEAKDEQKYDKEFVYILSDWNSKVEKGDDHHGAGHPRSIMDNDITTINERAVTGNNPIVMEAKQGESIRMRFANIGHLPHKIRLPEGFIVTHEDGYPVPEPKTQDSLTIYSGKTHDVVITAGKPGKMTFYHSINMPKGAWERLKELESPNKQMAEHKHEHSDASHDGSQEGVAAKSAKELPILELEVKGGGKK